MKCDPRILDLHRFSDSIMGRLAALSNTNGKPITCRSGCSSCCFEPVYCADVEVDHLLGRMTPQRRKVIAARTAAWLARVEPSGLLDVSEPDVIAWRDTLAPCPFLEGRLCSVYDDRPWGCRLHLAVGDPKLCDSQDTRRNQVYAMSPEVGPAVILHLLKLYRTVTLDHLGLWLARRLLGSVRESADTNKLVAK